MTNPPVSPTTPAPQTLEALRSAFDAAKIQEVFVNGDTADVYTQAPGNCFIGAQELIARCSCGELWQKRATAIAMSLNYVGALLANPSTAPGRLDREALTWVILGNLRTDMSVENIRRRITKGDPRYSVSWQQAFETAQRQADAVLDLTQQSRPSGETGGENLRETLVLIRDFAGSSALVRNDALDHIHSVARAALASPPAQSHTSNAPLTSLRQMVADKRVEARAAAAQSREMEGTATALKKALEFTVLAISFIGRDRGTSRLEGTLDDLTDLAVKLDPLLRAALATAPATDAGSGAGVPARGPMEDWTLSDETTRYLREIDKNSARARHFDPNTMIVGHDPSASPPQPGTVAGGGLSQAATDVLAERRRQVESEGWTPEHDDGHDKGELATAAACYATAPPATYTEREWMFADRPKAWPWHPTWWKPGFYRRNLVKSGALILAEIERLDRASLPTAPARGVGGGL